MSNLRASFAFIREFSISFLVCALLCVVGITLLVIGLGFLANQHTWLEQALSSDWFGLSLSVVFWTIVIAASFRSGHKAFMAAASRERPQQMALAYSVSVLVSIGVIAGLVTVLTWPVRLMDRDRERVRSHRELRQPTPNSATLQAR